MDPVILELKTLTVVADYFVVCSGESRTQVGAIAERVEEKLRESGIRPLSREGTGFNTWVLLDYGDLIVHIFEQDAREFYEIEKLWLDAPRIESA